MFSLKLWKLRLIELYYTVIITANLSKGLQRTALALEVSCASLLHVDVPKGSTEWKIKNEAPKNPHNLKSKYFLQSRYQLNLLCPPSKYL